MASFLTLILFTLCFIVFSQFFKLTEQKFSHTTTISKHHHLNKMTHLHFYFHDILSGKNPTAITITGDGKGFGTTNMIDDKLTQGPGRDSKIVGRAQGLYSFAAQNETAFLMVVTFTFNEGEYNGSSISMLGRNHVMDDKREMPIVGGSGVFRFARGYALAHTIWFDFKTGDATVEYNVFVEHY